MKVKRSQLNELIRLITRQVLKEYSSMSSGDDKESPDTSDKPEDAMTDLEKSRKERQDKIQAKRELDLAKKEKDVKRDTAQAYKGQYDQWRMWGKKDSEDKVNGLTAKVAGNTPQI